MNGCKTSSHLSRFAGRSHGKQSSFQKLESVETTPENKGWVSMDVIGEVRKKKYVFMAFNVRGIIWD